MRKKKNRKTRSDSGSVSGVRKIGREKRPTLSGLSYIIDKPQQQEWQVSHTFEHLVAQITCSRPIKAQMLWE